MKNLTHFKWRNIKEIVVINEHDYMRWRIQWDHRFFPSTFVYVFRWISWQTYRLTVGYYIGNIFIGAPAYADDIVLLSLTATATRLTFGICDHFALDYSILFHANTCKCISVGQSYGYSIPKNNLRAFYRRFFCWLYWQFASHIKLVIPATIYLT